MPLDPRLQPSWLQRLWPRGRGQPSTPLPRPGVDLVGSSSATPRPGDAPFAARPTAQDTSTGKGDDSWSFNQPVLLKPSPRPTTVIVWTLVGGTGLVLVWSLVAPLGESVAVQGKLQPGVRVKRVEAPVAGVVAEVLVKDGEPVQAGQLLLRFDLEQARNQLATAQAIRSRLLSENRIYADALGDRRAEGLSSNQRLQRNNQREQLRSRQQAAVQELRQSQQRLAGLRQAWKTAKDIADRYSSLARTGAASEVQELQTRDTVNKLQSQILEEERNIAKLQANLREVQSTPGADLRGRMEANLRQISDLDGQIRAARQQLQYGQLRTPVAGVVFDVRVTPSSVVAAAAPVLAIVPGGTLEARVLVPSKVIGFIRPGMKANISIDTFPSNDYGRLPGLVSGIGSDALTPEEMRSNLGAEATGLFYPVVLQLQRQHLQAGQRQVPLKAGMTLTADIQLRQRPFISVLTSFFEDKLRSLERLR
jgi:hemolysin D